MKRKKKLPRYWLGTRMPTSLGYQPNYGIGNTSYTSTPGIENVNDEAKTVRLNIAPGVINKGVLYGSMTSDILKNTTPVLTNASRKAMGNYLLNSFQQAVGSQTWSVAPDGTKILNEGTISATAPKMLYTQGLNAAGKALAVVGTAYGLTDMGMQIADNKSHRTADDMRNTLTTNTYTTDLGNTYTTHSGPNKAAEMLYARAQHLNKNLNFTTSAIGTGAAIGSLFPGYGTAIGAGVGALVGLGANLLGFGDTEEETKYAADQLGDSIAMENRMNESRALDQDVKLGFYSGIKSGNVAHAAQGKLPKFARGKINARVSNGEIQGNLKEGWAFLYGGIPNNDDKIKTHVDKSDYIISNPFVPYVKATGDIVGALTMQDMVNRNKKDYKSAPLKAKCGKLPGFKLGDFGEYAMTAVPNIALILAATQQYNVDRNMPVNVPRIQADYSAARNNAYRIAGLTQDMRPIYNAIDQLTANQYYNVMRMPGAGYGGRMVMLDSANTLAAKAKAEARYQAERDRIKQETLGLQAAANVNSHETDINNQNEIVVRGMTQQANAAKYNALAQDRKNMVTPLGPLFKDLQDIRKYYEAKDLKERMVKLYENQQDIDRQWLNNYLNGGNSSASTNSNYLKLITPNLSSYIPNNRYQIYKTPTLSAPQIPMYGYNRNYYLNPNNFIFNSNFK